MAELGHMLNALAARYVPGRVSTRTTFYFSVEGVKVTLVCLPDRCEVVHGPSDGQADVVVKCTRALFQRVFLDRKRPGALDIARGRFKTNDVAGLQRLERLFQS